jgi:hypothetical protein
MENSAPCCEAGLLHLLSLLFGFAPPAPALPGGDNPLVDARDGCVSQLRRHRVRGCNAYAEPWSSTPVSPNLCAGPRRWRGRRALTLGDEPIETVS